MSRWLVGMSGDKDAMIAHLEKCEKRMLKQFKEIRDCADKMKKAVNLDDYSKRNYTDSIQTIIDLCDVYLDKRSDKQKMQDELDELRERIKQLEGDSE
jgi:polyhydroxyalkanoate synthesis regulator phasin